MSGGHFDYQQFKLEEIADTLDRDVENNGKEDEYDYKTEYSENTIHILKDCSKKLKRLGKLVHDIDWCLSGDTDEERLLEQYKEFINKL